MSGSEKGTDEQMQKLLLDVKALVLLQGSDAELREKLQTRLAASDDESVRRFVTALQAGRRPGVGRLLVMAFGELVIASVLVVAGAVVLLPTISGVNTPAGLVQYFAEQFYGSVAKSPFSGYVSLLEFVLGAIMMVSAFYALRQAALDLKVAGVAVKSGED